MLRASTLVAALGLIAAPGCGGRTDLTAGASGGTTSGGGGGAGVASSLELVEGPFSIFPADFKWSAVKVVSRSGGVDVIANRDGVPFGVLARHATVAAAKPSITWSGPAVEILPGVVNGTIATADGDNLLVCHNQFVGDPSSISTFSGTYDKVSGPAVLFEGTMCQGVAFRDGEGLLAMHKLPKAGCCSRPEVFDIDGKGNLLSQGPELALPEGEFGDVRVTAYAGGFAWAGPIGGETSPGMHVRFRRATGTLAHTVPLDVAGERPDIAAWPFDAAAAISFPQGTGMRLVVVHESGALLVDDAIVAPSGDHVQRAPLGTSAHGVVSAYARCAEDFSTTPGELRVELRRPGMPMLETSLPVTCHAFVSTLAIVGDAVVVVFSSEDGLRGVVVKIVA